MGTAQRDRKGCTHRSIRAAAIAAAACGALGVTARDARATTAYSWESAVSGLWSDATKWTPDTGTPTLIDDSAALVASGAAHTVTLDADQSIGALTLDSLDATLALNGKTLTLTGGLTALNVGTINIDALASLVQSAGTFQVVGGAVTGPGRVTLNNNATLKLNGGGSGNFMFADNGTITGATAGAPFVLPGAMNLIVRADNAGSGPGTILSTSGGPLTAFGNITLDSTGGVAAAATLSVGGSFVNYGTLTSNPGSGGIRRIVTNTMTNYGSVNVNTDTTFDATISNYGSFTIAPGTSAIIGGGRSFIHNAGTLNIPAGTPLSISGGTFGMLGGTVNGTVNVNGPLSMNGAGGGGTFVVNGITTLTGGPQVLTATIPATSTIAIRGTQTFSSASLTSSGTLINNGQIVLDSLGAVSGSTFTFSGSAFTNNGTINSNVGSGGTRRIGASGGTFTNNGAININADTTVDASVLNYGSFTIAPGRTAIMQPFRSFAQLAGTLTTAPDVPLTIDSAGFFLNGGTVNGTVNLRGNSTFSIGGTLSGISGGGGLGGLGSGGTFVIQDTTTLSNQTSSSVTVPDNITVAIRGDQVSPLPSILSVSSTLTNEGAIILDSVGTSPTTGPGSATLVHTGFSFTNNGSITSNVGTGGARRIIGNSLVNNGTININTVTTLDLSITNYGTFAIAPGTTPIFSSGRSFTQAAGLLSIPADTPMNLTNTFSLYGGTVSGTVNLSTSASALVLAGGSGGTFVVQDSSFLSGSQTSTSHTVVPASTSLIIRGDSTGSFFGSTLTTSSSTFTNNGSITLDSTGGTAAPATFTYSGVSFTNTGSITSNPGSGGTRRIGGGTLINTGSVTINTDTTVDFSTQNYGTFIIAPGTNAILPTGRSFTQNAGSLTIAPDVPLTISNGTFGLNGGTVSGQVNLTGTTLLLFNGGNGGNFVVQGSATMNSTPPGTPPLIVPANASVTVRGSLGATAALGVSNPSFFNLGTIALDSAGAVAASTLNVTGATFTNYGFLNSNVGSGGTRLVNANLLNNFGTINVNAETNFNADVFNAGVIHLNEAATFRSLTGPGSMSGSGAKTFTGTSTLEAINTGNGQTTVESAASLTVGNIKDGVVTVNGLLTLAPSGESGGGAASKVDTLVIGATGKVNVNDSKLVVAGATASLAAVEAAIAAGANGGTWDGAGGIVTGMPDALTGLTSLGAATAGQVGKAGGTFGGVSVAGDDVLVMYTYAGDSNLDGFISGDDYSNIDFNIATPGATGWANGDFNHDGIISGDDYSVIDFNIVAQGTAFSTSGTTSGGLSGVTAVPEPASFAWFAVSALVIGRRRRRTPSI